MYVTVINDHSEFERIAVGTPQNPFATMPGQINREIVIKCDDEAGDAIIQFIREMTNR